MRYCEETNSGETKPPLLTRLFNKPKQNQNNNKDNETIDESTLVALSAIFAVDESWIIDNEKFRLLTEGKLNALLQAKYPEQFKTQETTQLNEFMAPMTDALNAHLKAFGHAIFADQEERRKLLHILAATKIN